MIWGINKKDWRSKTTRALLLIKTVMVTHTCEVLSVSGRLFIATGTAEQVKENIEIHYSKFNEINLKTNLRNLPYLNILS